MARRLKTLVKVINRDMPGYGAMLIPCRLDTDGHCPGGWILLPRKGIPGNRIRIWHCATGIRVLSYHTGEPHRTNECIEEWIREHQGPAHA